MTRCDEYALAYLLVEAAKATGDPETISHCESVQTWAGIDLLREMIETQP